MNIEQESNNDLIGDEWRNTTSESEESSFDESPIEESFYDTSIVTERLNREHDVIDSALNEALERNLIETSKLDSGLDLSSRKEKLNYILFTKSGVFSKDNRISIFSIIINIAILIAIVMYAIDYQISTFAKYLIVAPFAVSIKASYNKIKYGIRAFDINPFYIKIGKLLIKEKGNTLVFFNTILGVSFNIEDFDNINSNSKIDNTIQFIKSPKEENAIIPYSQLHLCYNDNGIIKTISIDLDKVEVDKFQFVKLLSALRRSNKMQRKYILSLITGNAVVKKTEIDDTIQDSQTAQSKLTHDIIIAETEEQSIGHNLDKYNCEICFDRPKGFMYKGKKGAIKINPESIFLEFGVCNEEDDITIAFDNIIGIAYDENEAKKGITEKTLELEEFIDYKEDEEISIYHQQGENFINTKVYIGRIDIKQGKFFEFILLLNRHNLEERIKILQMHKTELEK
jgi:hypothetical protein